MLLDTCRNEAELIKNYCMWMASYKVRNQFYYENEDKIKYRDKRMEDLDKELKKHKLYNEDIAIKIEKRLDFYIKRNVNNFRNLELKKRFAKIN